ncbi:MAG TPA: cupin-like domain-containing protein [Candidatus Binatia bacterium]|nr:cupin-like domain-containing protein [Candidatus Binatia bacterium]
MEEIERVAGTEPAEIARRIAAARPVIFTDMSSQWPACHRWSLDYLRSFADRRVLVAQSYPGRLDVSSDGIPQKEIPLGEFLDGLAGGRTDRYLITPLRSTLPELVEDLRWPAVFEQASFSDLRIWLGPADYCTPLHRDMPDNLFLQVFGSKNVILLPRDVRGVYRHGVLSGAPNFACVDAEDPDLSRFPRFPADDRITCVVRAGEVLYIPRLWWHQLRSIDVSASVSLWFANGLPGLLARGAQRYASWRKLRP